MSRLRRTQTLLERKKFGQKVRCGKKMLSFKLITTESLEVIKLDKERLVSVCIVQCGALSLSSNERSRNTIHHLTYQSTGKCTGFGIDRLQVSN